MSERRDFLGKHRAGKPTAQQATAAKVLPADQRYAGMEHIAAAPKEEVPEKKKKRFWGKIRSLDDSRLKKVEAGQEFKFTKQFGKELSEASSKSAQMQRQREIRERKIAVGAKSSGTDSVDSLFAAKYDKEREAMDKYKSELPSLDIAKEKQSNSLIPAAQNDIIAQVSAMSRTKLLDTIQFTGDDIVAHKLRKALGEEPTKKVTAYDYHMVKQAKAELARRDAKAAQERAEREKKAAEAKKVEEKVPELKDTPNEQQHWPEAFVPANPKKRSRFNIGTNRGK